MCKNRPALNAQLSLHGVFGPGSIELERYENALTRYFEKEYRKALKDPQSLKTLGVATDSGPIAQETEILMARHYDERIDFFSGFLDQDYRAYSMAYYGETRAAIHTSVATLEEAQRTKFSLIANRAQITGRERIINIGCGFGSLETYLLQTFPEIEIVGVTPSKVQVQYLRQRMQNLTDPLGSGRFTLIESPFQNLTLEILGNKKYDLAISVGLFEHLFNMRASLKSIATFLKPNGKTFHHFITSQIAIPKLLNPRKTRIGQYFPGCRVWPQSELSRHTEDFDLVDRWFVNGLNYWRTLEEWHQRYWNSIPELYGTVFDIAAIKHWNEYFSISKAMFAPLDGTFYGNSQYLFKRKD